MFSTKSTLLPQKKLTRISIAMGAIAIAMIALYCIARAELSYRQQIFLNELLSEKPVIENYADAIHWLESRKFVVQKVRTTNIFETEMKMNGDDRKVRLVYGLKRVKSAFSPLGAWLEIRFIFDSEGGYICHQHVIDASQPSR